MANDKKTTENVGSDFAHKVEKFIQLLDKINNLDNKKKELWKQIYENAIIDRNYAHTMFSQLMHMVSGKSTEHAIQGQNMNKYLERMGKSNDQLIKLAELIAQEEEKSVEETDSDEIFAKINEK